VQTKQLGTLTVPALCLGHSMGAQDFSADSEREFHVLIARALDLGLNFFDSSDAYWNGLHETWLGRARAGRRPASVEPNLPVRPVSGGLPASG
jgi:aryl-alcohol dehydrogenase-like predicted oxidoreductase